MSSTTRRDPAKAALSIWGVIVFIFLFLPIIWILVYSFNTGRLLTQWNGFGFEGYQTVIEDPVPRNAIFVSIRTAAMTSVLATILGSAAGVALARRPGRWVPFFLFFVALVLVTPEIIDAIALLPWYVFLGQDFLGPDRGLEIFNNGYVRLVFSHTIFTTAVVALIVRARLSGIDESLEEAAADLYAPPFKRFSQITLPLMLPAVLAGALLAFTLSLDNTVISSFVAPQGTNPWPVYVFSAVRAELRPHIASLSTLMFMLTIFAIAMVAVVLRRGGDSTTKIAGTMTGTN